MTREEMLEVIKKIQSAYPNFKVEDKQAFLDTWYECLGEYSFEAVALALKSYIMSDKSGFAPSIGALNDILQNIAEQLEGETLNEMQAWSLVSKALRKSAWHSEEAFNELPPLVRKAVGSPQVLKGWALDENYSEDVAMSNFQRTYRAVTSQARSNRRMSLDVQHMIAEKEAQYLRLGGGSNG